MEESKDIKYDIIYKIICMMWCDMLYVIGYRIIGYIEYYLYVDN